MFITQMSLSILAHTGILFLKIVLFSNDQTKKILSPSKILAVNKISSLPVYQQCKAIEQMNL